ncbi:oligosaccharyl transferase [Thermococcus sp. 2319x1]|uniref:hypothetical protein n=1 Tax=Thermococcus sp. 2319x1 TaxID=1674923 RepID=UPI00073AA7F5|nr:hypothetical protein [Thermococcus sp. 2319x1]ALV63874.1 oligosaccharyl transferase [Thermococcus sp. 2319x1]
MESIKQLSKTISAIIVIIFITLTYRIYPYFKCGYLFGFDPYVHVSVIREMLKGNLQYYPLSNAPFGAEITEPLGLYYVPLYVYKTLSIFGVSLYNAFRITPVIFGLLTVLFFFMAVLNFYGRKEAIFSALFLSLSYGHIHRSMANYYRGDNYILFLFSVLLFLLSVSLKNRGKLTYYLSFLGIGIILGISAFFWWGYPILFIFTVGIALSWGVALFLWEEERIFMPLALLSTTLIGALIAKILSGPHWNPMYSSFPIIFVKYLFLPSLFILSVFLILSKVRIEFKYRLFVLVIGGFLFGFLSLTIFREQIASLFKAFGYFSGNRIYGTIMELQRPKVSDLWRAFSISILFVPFYLLQLRRRRVINLLSLGWILPSVYLLVNAVRFVFLASLGVAFMSGLGFSYLLKIIDEKCSKRQVISIFLIFLVFASVGYFSFASLYNTKPFMSKNWERALIYLKEHSNSSDVVLTWWDYGGFVQYYAERPTVADSVYGQGNAPYVAKYYLGLLPQKELEKRQVKYVVVNLELVNKFGAILETAGVNSGEYSIMLLPLEYTFGAFVFSKGGYKVVAKPGDAWEVKVVTPKMTFTPKEVWVERGKEIVRAKLKEGTISGSVVYINLNYGYAVLMSEKAFNTPLAQLMFINSTPFYSDGGIIKIFKVK